MTKDEFADCLTELGLTKTGAARMFHVNQRTTRRWSSGELEVPQPVALALALMVRYRVKPERALMLAGRDEKHAA